MITKSFVIALLGLTAATAQTSLVNFSHLSHLTERVIVEGDSVDVIHIYADAPSYAWVDANQEGIACVDDAARAAVVYLRHAELYGDATSFQRAKELLRFILLMQTEEGLFNNFILADRSINRTGSTSFTSFGWWAGRGVWSFGLGYRLFKTTDPEFAAILRRGVERTFTHLDTLLRRYGQTTSVARYRIPQWLLYASGSDATSELVLGLIEYYRAEPSAKVRGYIEKLCEGMMIMQDGNVKKFPYGAHRSWETKWHAWGNSQTMALATAGRLLGNKRMIAAAAREADGFYARLIALGNKREFDVIDTTAGREFEQIAYDIRPMAVGLLRLSEATGDVRYARMAGLAASWFFGNNVTRTIMYDTSSGRGYDGIRSGTEVNLNSGAESTIEALLAVLEVEQIPEARKFLFHKKQSFRQTKTEIAAKFSGVNDTNALKLVIDIPKARLRIINDATQNKTSGRKQ